ncbi:MAG: hypothetical protein NVS9B1_17110 [Candidatus Dormibacteraceae bacterium]
MDVERTTPEILPVFKALADESRLRIIGLLANREHSVEELATTLRLKAATVSHHLATLRGVDLVAMRAEGTTHVYRFQPEALRRLNRELAPERLRSIPQDLDGDAWERKVLGDFLVDGRLPALPVNARKRLVVLRWLAGKFAFGRAYPELEVNAIIAEFHNDYASVRRYFVDLGFMSRASGLYRRLEREG